MTGIYTPTGPFTDGGAPGMSAGFLNAVETWIEYVDNPTAITVTGSSGTVKLYQFLRGTVKAALVVWTSYVNSTAQTLLMPVAFTASATFTIGETQGGTIKFLSSGTAVVCSVQNVVSSTGGTQNAVTLVGPWTHGATRGGFDTLSMLFANGTVASGSMLLWGI